MGVDVNRTIAITFLIAGALAGAAGVVQILYNNTTVWNLGFRFGLNSFTAAVLGGIGNLQGAVLGALVLGFINAFSDRFFSANWTNALVFGDPDRDPGVQAHRPPRPAAGGSGMSTATKQVGSGIGGWVGHMVDAAAAIPGHYGDLLRQRRGRTIALTLLGDRRVIYPIIYNQVLAGFSRNVFPLPFPDETTMTFMLIFGIMAIGLNIVVGFAGLLDLGYVAFYALGAYTAAFFASPHFGSSASSCFSQRGRALPGHPPAVLDDPADGGPRGRDVRRAARRTDPPPARRLPGDRDPRLRRDRAGLLQEPGGVTFTFDDRRRDPHPARERQPDRRAAGHQPDRSPFCRSWASVFGATLGRRRGLLRDGPDDHRHHRRPQPRAVTHRAAPGAPSARTRPPPR